MKNIVFKVFVSIILITILIFGILSGFDLVQLQKKTLKIVSIICLCSMIYCFIVGEITRNNSQMDKLWSILPIAYAWVIAGMGHMKPRLIIMAVLITVWGLRLTINFARKGAYSIKFWQGEEDYRWKVLRDNPIFKNHKIRWALFDLLFISIFQNAIVLAITLPMLAVMCSNKSLFYVDYIAAALTAFFIIYETIADEQQMRFQNKKWDMIKSGMKLEELPYPYSKGFNTTGLWKYSRHPNYISEQMIWVSLYIFVLGAGMLKYHAFNWSLIGAVLLIFIFMGSSVMAEAITSEKYPEYKDYQKRVFKYLPIRRYNK